MEIPFEYCALRYLLQWESKEKPLHLALKDDPATSDIRRALQFFQVARTFKGLKSDAGAETIRKAVSRITHLDESTFEHQVCHLATCFKDKFDRFNVSAASKLLWLKFRSPVIIYDSRALTALKDMGCEIATSDYQSYCASWRKKYKESGAEIRAAVARLNDVRPFFLPAWHVSDRHLQRLSHYKWFRERVFDIYLWAMGERSGAQKNRNRFL